MSVTPFKTSEQNREWVNLKLLVKKAARKAAMGGSKATGERERTEASPLSGASRHLPPLEEGLEAGKRAADSRPYDMDGKDLQVAGMDPMHFFYAFCDEQTRRFRAEEEAESMRKGLVMALKDNARLRRENDRLRAEAAVNAAKEAARG